MDNRLIIYIEAQDKATQKINKNLSDLEKKGQKSTQTLTKSFKSLHLQAIAVAAAIAGVAVAVKSMVKAASEVEQFRTRLTTLLGTVEAGNMVFKDMADLASKVPKTYDEIMASATNLAGVVKDGTREIKQLMPIIVDISSATGLTVEETTGQMIRMYSAGAASADMFRERGISAALGFQAGVSYTAEETMEHIISQWEDGTGKFVGASEDLAETWEGKMSMMADAAFKLRSALGELIIDNEGVIAGVEKLTGFINSLASAIKALHEESQMGILAGDPTALNNAVENADSRMQAIMLLAETTGLSGTELLGKAEDMGFGDLQAKNQQKLEIEKTFQKELTAVEKKNAEEREKNQTKLDQKQMKTREQFNSWLLSNMKTTFQMAAQENKAFAVLLQAVNIGEAIMNTATGVTQALASYPPPVSFIMAGLVAAMGAAQVGIIASQGFAEGTDNVPAALSAGEMVVPRTFAESLRSGDLVLGGRGAGMGGNVSVSIQINNPVVDTLSKIDDLVEEISNRISREVERL